MANLSDAFGTITVESVGQEFLDYLKAVQGSEEQAYYKLVELDQLENVKPDEKGNLIIDFSTYGRWNYESNIKGYLLGEWANFTDDSDEKVAYNKLVDAIIEKKGVVDVDYTDSDGAMDWMGTGGFRLFAENGELHHASSFDEERITVSGYADMNGYSEIEALEMLYGDEVAEKYDKYVKEWKATHEYKEGDSEPAGPSEWYDNEYQLEEE